MTAARRTQLADCNPRWVITRGGGPTCGVSFDCPEPHSACRHIIPFTPTLEDSPAESWQENGAIWQRTGETFETLTLEQSIRRVPTYANPEAAVAAGALLEYLNDSHFCAMHIFIRGGRIEFRGDSR